MAKLHIREYQEAAAGGEHRAVGIPVGRERRAISQTPIEIGVTSVSSAPFAATTRMIRVHAKAACHIEFGGADASPNTMPMSANQTEYWGVEPGDVLSVILAS